MREPFRFVVYGLPIAGGSKRAFPIRRKDGSLGVAVSDSSGTRGKAWRTAMQDAARAVYAGAPLEGALRVRFVFAMPRPKGHFTARGALRPSAPAVPTTRPDVLKLARAAEDALSGIVWRDDAQIVEEYLAKLYVSAEAPSALVEVTPLGAPAVAPGLRSGGAPP